MRVLQRDSATGALHTAQDVPLPHAADNIERVGDDDRWLLGTFPSRLQAFHLQLSKAPRASAGSLLELTRTSPGVFAARDVMLHDGSRFTTLSTGVAAPGLYIAGSWGDDGVFVCPREDA